MGHQHLPWRGFGWQRIVKASLRCNSGGAQGFLQLSTRAAPTTMVGVAAAMAITEAIVAPGVRDRAAAAGTTALWRRCHLSL